MYKNFRVKIIVFIIFFIITVGIYLFAGKFFDNRVNDFFINIFTSIQNKKPADDVVLVVIDDKSLKNIAWPWRRDLFSDIFDFLENEAHAKSIAFDNLILFPDTYYPDSDLIFNERLKNQNILINSYILFNSNMAGDILPREYVRIFDTKSNVVVKDERSDKSMPSYRGVINIPKSFLNNTKYLASSVIPEDDDTIVRHYMPVVLYNGNLYPSLALSAYAMYSGINHFVLYDKYLCSDDGCETLKIPIQLKQGTDYIGNTIHGIFSTYKWYNVQNKFYTHKSYSAIDVLLSYYAILNGKTPKINPEVFKDKIVVVGLNADKNVWERLSETPVLKKQADIDVHATMISNMLENKFFTIAPKRHIVVITFIFCLFIIRGFRRLKRNLIYSSAFVGIYFIYYLYQYFNNIYVPPFSPILAMYCTAFFKYVFKLITTDKYSELIKKAMSKYMSKDVMNKVVSNLDNIDLGGIKAEVTVLFIDIRNFTGISENLTAQEVSYILNEYFSVVEPIIAKYNGVVNKYMGDGILSIFGEPIRNKNHAINAVMCSNEIIKAVGILKNKFIQENKPVIDIGVGINTGEVFAGNIGSDERLEYTVIGDNVNLAYRIESYNHILKTQFLISEYTYEQVKNYVDVVKLSQVSIKGKSKPIDIYEVLKINKYDE